MSVLVRETQPLAVTYEVETPSGKRYRWAPDEWSPENVPLDATFTDTMPGGFDSLDVTLRRHAEVDYEDLERLSTIRVRDSSHAIVGEYRLERAPRSSGDDLAIRPSAVGWQAHLEDDKTARVVYVDRDLTKWEGPSIARQTYALGAGYTANSANVDNDPSGTPSLDTTFTGPWVTGSLAMSEGWYDAKNLFLSSLEYAWKKNSNVDAGNGNWVWQAFVALSDQGTTVDASGNLRAAGPGTGTVTATAGSQRSFAFVQHLYNNAAGGQDNQDFTIWWTVLAVFGNHGLTKRGSLTTTTASGFYASDIVGHAVAEWAPLLRTTADSLPQSALIITQASYLDATTVAEIVRDNARYEMLDWAVWEDRTFYMHPRNARGRSWRARVGPTRLEETGPQVDRLWNGVVVEFRDAAGGTVSVGPPYAGFYHASADLLDLDPENPANKIDGLKRYERVSMDSVGDVDTAIALGRAFLQETKRLDRSGRATIVGYVEDDRGVTWPYHAIRAGDTISFVDAADPSPRRIVRTSKDIAARSCTIDLDAPPEGLQAVLARLGLSMGST